MAKLTLKEKATNYETMVHIQHVQKAVNKLSMLAIERGRVHDRSKLDVPEVEYFSKYTEELKDLTYNSDEYKECLNKMKPAIDHHYAANRHHPEHFPDGVAGMSIVDLLEMVSDWWSSAKRQNNGNLRISLEESCKRFGIEPQLASIIKNTIDILEEGVD
jgi:hypothetical protein